MASTYTDYDFYKSENGSLSEKEYNKFAIEAAQEIRFRTSNRAETATGEMLENIRFCEVKLVDALYQYDLLPTAISSENNDGYSVQYASSAVQRADKARTIMSICRRWLRTPENLLYRGLEMR